MKSYHTLLSSLLLSLLLLSACNGSDSNSASTSNKTGTTETKEAPVGAINEERTFANNVWNSQSPEIFVIDITDSNAYYSIEFTVAIDTAVYRYETVPFYTDIFTPDGAHRHLTPEFPTKQYGRWKGEMRDGYRIISTSPLAKVANSASRCVKPPRSLTSKASTPSPSASKKPTSISKK